jgi:hypothetical protein
MVLPATRQLCERLEHAVHFLDAGDVIAAANELAQVQDLYPTLPVSIPESELMEIRQLFLRCTTAGEKQRLLLTEALRKMGAGRRGLTYR